jgi:hypothetical protein
METDFKAAQKNSIEALVTPLPGKHLRIILQQFGADGLPRRSWGGAPPDGQKMDSLLRIIAEQGKRQLPLKIEYDKMIWSGLSWAAAEISPDNFDAGKPLKIRCISVETDPLQLQARVYGLTY